MAERLTKDNLRGKIIMKNSKLSLYRSSFVYRGADLWNKLPDHLRTSSKIGSFKKGLKVWVVENVPRFSN